MIPRKSHSKPGLARSNTRITLLEYCEKKYFFNYYSFALKKIDPLLREETMILKYLKSMEMWMGEKTHILLSNYLHLLQENRSVSPEELEELKNEISEMMHEEFNASKNKDYQTFDYHDRAGLSEHFYQQDADDLLEPTIQRVIQNLDALIASPWHQKILEMMNGTHIVYIEKPKNPDFESMKINTKNIPELREISVMASPDFGVIFGNNRYFILDRKSGKESNSNFGLSDQLKVYSLKLLVNTKKNTQLEDYQISAYEVYLPSTQEYGGEISQRDIDDIIEKIAQDTQFQKTFLVDQDPIKNIPLPHTHFSRTSKKTRCESCSFRSVCEKLKEFE